MIVEQLLVGQASTILFDATVERECVRGDHGSQTIAQLPHALANSLLISAPSSGCRGVARRRFADELWGAAVELDQHGQGVGAHGQWRCDLVADLVRASAPHGA